MEVPERWKKLLVAAGLLFQLLAIVLSLIPAPDAAIDGDVALLELSARQTARGDNLLGPYSRFYFNHPGPAYFLVVLPLYLATGQTAGSLLLTAALLNLLAVAIVYMAVRRQPVPVVIGTGILLSLLIAWLGSLRLTSAWNPEISILAFGAAVFSFAAAGSGRPVYLLPGLGLATFAVQSHIGYGVSSALVVLVSLLAVGFPRLTGSRRRHWDWWMAGGFLAQGLVLWLPALYEEAASAHGNLSKLGAFFALPHRPTTVAETWDVLGPLLTVFVPVGSVRSWLSGALIVSLPVAYLHAVRRGEKMAASLSLVSMAAVAGAAFAISRIVGPVHDHLVNWIPVLGLAGMASILMALAPFTAALSSRVRRAGPLILMGLFLTIAAANTWSFWAPGRLQDWPDLPKHRAIARLADQIALRLQQDGVGYPQVRIATTSAWPAAAGVVLRMDKLGVPFCVEDDWVFLVGRGLECRRQADGLLIFGNSEFQQAVLDDPRFRPVAAWPEGAVFLASQPPAAESIDFSGPESVLYLSRGFSVLSGAKRDHGRWSVGPFSEMTLPLAPGKPHRLVLSARPLTVPQRVQSITLSLNDRRLTEFPLADQEIPYVIQLPAEQVLAVNQLRFDYAYSEPPMLHHPDSDDWRPLGVFFRWMRIAVPSQPDG